MLKSTCLSALAFVLLGTASAVALEKPTGDVVLKITGHVTDANNGNVAEFDMPMLEALVGRSAKMETPWTDGTTEFQGPLLKAVLEAAGADGKALRVKALNDYAADVPMEDVTAYDTMLATKINGKPMSVRDKGPLFLIYPFDQNPELYNEKYFSRSVWQITEIEVIN